MCFSADADLAAGIIVSAVGVDAIRRARTPSQLPLASLPLLLGVHQLIESLVWRGLSGEVSSSLGDAATSLFLAVAFVLPVWVPLAVRGVEPSSRRRRNMAALAALGALVAFVLLGATARGPVEAAIAGHHIAYAVAVPSAGAIGTLYVLATCGALLMSSERSIRYFGVSNLVAVTGLAWLTIGGLTSLWCAWAAITSVGIDLYLRDVEGRSDLAFA